ncbi:hypothetical protein [Kordia jejudonensis]|uniref:hypothetical protein n=1 Tax=Kordia jejudonensis TaxID=1348245 RepID=UPI000629AD9A|nr:hypothetical protein [Kordia jejudonensis]
MSSGLGGQLTDIGQSILEAGFGQHSLTQVWVPGAQTNMFVLSPSPQRSIEQKVEVPYVPPLTELLKLETDIFASFNNLRFFFFIL